MHWVEVRRWQDYKNFGSVNEGEQHRVTASADPPPQSRSCSDTRA
jgi:hypothetical protein